jgi:hypothetical protein
MTDVEYAEARRLRTTALLKIAEGIYDDEERAMIECAIRELEVLAIAAGPGSPALEVSSDLAQGRPSARDVVSRR